MSDINDPFELRGKKLCGKNNNLYFNTVYARSNFYVYSLCYDKELTNCSDILAKVYELNSWKGPQDILNEISFMEKASKLRVSPRFIGAQACNYNNKDYYVLIMENYGNKSTGNGSLTSLLLNFPDFVKMHHSEIQQKLKYILDKLYDNGIDHNDVHSGNFLYKINEDGEIDFKIIDFDLARTFDPMKPPLNFSKRKYIISGEKDEAITNDLSSSHNSDFNLVGGIFRKSKRRRVIKNKSNKFKNIKNTKNTKNKKTISKKFK